MAIALRSDFDAFLLRAIARASKDAPQARRLLALAAIYDGSNRSGLGCQVQRRRPRRPCQSQAARAAFEAQ